MCATCHWDGTRGILGNDGFAGGGSGGALLGDDLVLARQSGGSQMRKFGLPETPIEVRDIERIENADISYHQTGNILDDAVSALGLGTRRAVRFGVDAAGGLASGAISGVGRGLGVQPWMIFAGAGLLLYLVLSK